jgi:hypothetical protein
LVRNLDKQDEKFERSSATGDKVVYHRGAENYDRDSRTPGPLLYSGQAFFLFKEHQP